MGKNSTGIVASTPQTITTVHTVTGKVWHVTPPNSVILTLEDGTNQSFKIPNGQKFTIDGQQVDAFGLKKGMVVTTTKIVEVPETVVSQHKHVSGTMPTPLPQAPPADVPILVATRKPAAAPAPATAETAATAPAAKLPKTGSNLPLVALLGLLLISTSLGIRLMRTILSLRALRRGGLPVVIRPQALTLGTAGQRDGPVGEASVSASQTLLVHSVTESSVQRQRIAGEIYGIGWFRSHSAMRCDPFCSLSRSSRHSAAQSAAARRVVFTLRRAESPGRS